MFFQSTAVTTGIMRKGVMSRVRATPWPRKGRFKSMANSRPKINVMMTTLPVNTMVFQIIW